MKGPTIEEVRALQKETGEGMMACKKMLEQKYAEEEKKEMLENVKQLYYGDKCDQDLYEILLYLVRKA
jgi:translation elongation factor EF-Ts